MKKIIISVMLLACFNNSFSGIKSLTANSRANCINNESVSWYLWHYYHLLTNTQHYYRTQGVVTVEHGVSTGWQYTWRSAAVHWGEGSQGGHNWEVHGQHWVSDQGATFQDGVNYELSGAIDCRWYDGWWEH